MVVEDTSNLLPLDELPHFTCFVKHDQIVGEAYALGMNGWILDIISGRTKNASYPILESEFNKVKFGENVPPYWISQATKFLDAHFGKEKITVAGKNVAGFDIPFLPKEISSRFRHKVLDPGTLFVDWEKDNQVPNFPLCKERAGLPKEIAHDARADALDVIALLRKFYQ